MSNTDKHLRVLDSVCNNGSLTPASSAMIRHYVHIRFALDSAVRLVSASEVPALVGSAAYQRKLDMTVAVCEWQERECDLRDLIYNELNTAQQVTLVIELIDLSVTVPSLLVLKEQFSDAL